MKKQIKILLVLIILVSLIMPVALAEEKEISIDMVNVYDEMGISYLDGYTPNISGSYANVLMPLVNDTGKEIDNDRIKVTFDVGQKTQTPFYLGSHYQYVKLKEHAINNTENTKEVYLVDYRLPLVWNRVNGEYPVVVNVEYKIDGEEHHQEFVVYVCVTDGKDRYDYKSDKEPNSRDKHSAPDIIISEYSFSESVVQAGDEFSVYLTLKNTSDTWHAHNIRFESQGETTDIISTDMVGALFIDELENEEEVNIILGYRVRQDAEAGAQKITVKMTYEDNMNSSCTSDDEIIMEIQQPIRLEHDEVNMPKTVNAGDSLPITMQIFNMGKSPLYNVLAEINMPGVIPDGSSYFGNMESGDFGTAEIYAFFGTLDMGENGLDSDMKYGVSTGTMTITYEDEFGRQYEEVIDLKATIERPVFDDIYNKDEVEEEEPEKMSSWWISIFILAAAAAAILGVTSYRRKINQLKREYGHLDN